MTRLSIGVRLTLWYLAIFALGQFAFGVGMWLVLRHHLVSIVDDSLRDKTGDLRSFLDAQKKTADLDKFREEVTETYSQEHAGEYLAVATSNGDLVYVSDSLKDTAVFSSLSSGANPPKPLLFQDRVIHEKPVRFLRSSIATHGLTFVVQMGAPLKDVWQTLNSFRNYLLWLAPLVLLTSAAGGYWLSRRALAPVDALTRTARTISGNNLTSRLEKLNTGDELQRLSDTLNEMLERIEKAFLRITQFTADASHELRTPISLVRTEAEVALRKSRDADTYREALRHILKEVERTSVLIEDLFALARADSGAESLKLQPVELNSWLQDSITEWNRLAAALGHQLVSHFLDSGEIWVMADESALRRLLAILLDNAVKYTAVPGRIDVSLEQRNARALLRVSDTGIGMPATEHDKIFERFYRVDKAHSRASGGAGLGLAIARWIVDQHKGTISVESEENVGSRFSVELPAQQKPVPLNLTESNRSRSYSVVSSDATPDH